MSNAQETSEEGGLPESFVTGQPTKQRCVSHINVHSASVLGTALLVKVVEKALEDNGFTNVNVIRNHATYPGAPKQPDPDTVLAAIMERNPTFLQSEVKVTSNCFHSTDIPPDSEYPAAGLPVKQYEVSKYSQNTIEAVDAAGGREHIGHINSTAHAAKIIDALNKDLGVVA